MSTHWTAIFFSSFAPPSSTSGKSEFAPMKKKILLETRPDIIRASQGMPQKHKNAGKYLNCAENAAGLYGIGLAEHFYV